MDGLVGKKSYQTQVFLQDGTRVPLTAVVAKDLKVTQIKTQDKEGYNGLQLAMDIKKKANKAITGHSKKAGLENAARFFKEIRLSDAVDIQPGTQLNPSDVFKPGDIVDVTGVSKGKGFAGVVKRHHFKGGPRTHGQSDRERAPGSIGQTTTPGRVYRGKRMAGRMGNEQATVKNLIVLEVTNDGVILIKGLVPGPLNNLVVVKKVGESKKFVPLNKEIPSAPVLEGQEVQMPEQEVKTAAEEVQVPAEEVKTSEQVQTPAEEVKTGKQVETPAEDIKPEEKKAAESESKEEIKEENAS